MQALSISKKYTITFLTVEGSAGEFIGGQLLHVIKINGADWNFVVG